MRAYLNEIPATDQDLPWPLDAEGRPCAEGVYEAMKIRDGAPEFLHRHLRRLQDSAGALGYPGDAVDPAFLARCAREVEGLGRHQALVVARLSDGQTFAAFRAYEGWSRDALVRGAHLAGSVPSGGSTPHKRLPSLDLAAPRPGDISGAGEAEEHMRLDPGGFVLGGSKSNLFAVRQGVLTTPPLAAGAFPGIMRGAVLEAAADLGIALREELPDRGVLTSLTEVFVTSSLVGLASIARVDGVALPSPARPGAPPPIIPALRIRVRAMIAAEGAAG